MPRNNPYGDFIVCSHAYRAFAKTAMRFHSGTMKKKKKKKKKEWKNCLFNAYKRRRNVILFVCKQKLFITAARLSAVNLYIYIVWAIVEN